jgi:hypothetical protein
MTGSAVQLIRSVLDERSRSRSNVCTGNVAYCPQLPPMHAGTIRSNILMGSGYDASLYHSVLDGCCLTQDLEVSSCSFDVAVWCVTEVLLRTRLYRARLGREVT